MTRTGRQAVVARILQHQAAQLPLARANGVSREHFAPVDRELTWGLTLNK